MYLNLFLQFIEHDFDGVQFKKIIMYINKKKYKDKDVISI